MSATDEVTGHVAMQQRTCQNFWARLSQCDLSHIAIPEHPEHPSSAAQIAQIALAAHEQSLNF